MVLMSSDFCCCLARTAEPQDMSNKHRREMCFSSTMQRAFLLQLCLQDSPTGKYAYNEIWTTGRLLELSGWQHLIVCPTACVALKVPELICSV